MQTNVIWQGLEYNSLENCIISSSENGYEINATVVGHYDRFIYLVQYTIKTNKNWETLFLDITIQHSNQRKRITLDCDGKGHWYCAGEIITEYNGCIDPDISITPFTNTLPVKRYKLAQHEGNIKVLYIDVFELAVRVAHQRYAHRSGLVYHFETVPKDFEAEIAFNDWGIVMEYPALFRCLDITASHYG
jgi:hypothetical protein